MSDCKHKEMFPIARDSLWGPWDWFCKACGTCPADPSIPARSDEAAKVREEDKRAEEWVERWNSMTPEEQAEEQKQIGEGLEESLADLKEQLKPFEGGTYRPYGYF